MLSAVEKHVVNQWYISWYMSAVFFIAVEKDIVAVWNGGSVFGSSVMWLEDSRLMPSVELHSFVLCIKCFISIADFLDV